MAIAVSEIATSWPAPAMLVGMIALLFAATFAEAYPVPVENVPADGVSLAAVFIVGAGLVFGWATAAVCAALTQVVLGAVERRPPVRLAYNASAYALAGAVAGMAATLVEQRIQAASLLFAVLAGSAGFYAVNVVLVVAVISRVTEQRFGALLTRTGGSTIIPFAIMASATLMLKVLWDRSPFLLFALIGPLLAISLYQRSVHRALTAMRLALTDPLTELGNHRHFHERTAQDLERARREGVPFTLCLIDLDDFKKVNDRHGHPIGDQLLTRIASCLRHDGEAFRLGGDEFAVVLPGRGRHDGLLVAEAIIERIAAVSVEHGGHISASAGVATYPDDAKDRDELIRLADSALYWAKERGKNRVRVYTAEFAELGASFQRGEGLGSTECLRAAASLARAVDARDAFTGQHSARVGVLASCVGARMGLSGDEIELLRVAGELHDLGKLAIPEEILCKPGPLDDSEWRAVARHPEVGFRLLKSLGADAIAEWVLHHHERWDGRGYPDNLRAEDIPLESRILFVCDAYDAITTERVYREEVSTREAIEELMRCAGTQFDPRVVAALAAAVGQPAISLARPARAATAPASETQLEQAS